MSLQRRTSQTRRAAPSRALSSGDCMLSACIWKKVEERWGPHSVDLMALDSDAPNDLQGLRLRHFSPWPTQETAGVHVVSQTLHSSDNAYVFPPLALVASCLASQPCTFTIIVPDLFPRRYWWPVVTGHAVDSIHLGSLGDHGVLLFPSSDGQFCSRPLDWDIWAFRVSA